MQKHLADHARAWIARIIETEPRPGSLCDRKIGLQMGHSRETIGYHRRLLGILPANDRRELAVARMIRHEDKRRPLTDSQIGERVGVSRQAAHAIRTRLGFASARKRRQAAERGS